MKITIQLLVVLFLFCGISPAHSNSASNQLQGKWVRMGHSDPVALNFKPNGTVEVDFGNDQTTDVVTSYKTKGNTISFIDKEGAMCPEPGVYKFEKNGYYLSFDLVNDLCNGRVKMTMGDWTKPNFEELIDELSQNISETENPKLNLIRSRVYMALGKSKEAKTDLDVFLEQNPNNARALINRAGTSFPADMEGVVSDCNKTISLEPKNKMPFLFVDLHITNWAKKNKPVEISRKQLTLDFQSCKLPKNSAVKSFGIILVNK